MNSLSLYVISIFYKLDEGPSYCLLEWPYHADQC